VTDFWCFPQCIACSDIGFCSKANTIQAHEIVAERKRRRVEIDEVILPCGHWGLIWPLVHVLGDNFAWILCDKCGWIKISKTAKERMKKDARTLFQKTTRTPLPLEPEF
jgi:hypothetical protein